MSKICILGCGAWGIALGLSAYNCSHEVVMWSPFEDEVNLLSTTRENQKLLSGVKIPEEIKITSDLNDLNDGIITIIATPSFSVRQTAKRINNIKNPGIIVNVAKGIEKDTLMRFSQVIRQEIGNLPVAVLSGPSHAEEVGRGVPTAIIAASSG